MATLWVEYGSSMPEGCSKFQVPGFKFQVSSHTESTESEVAIFDDIHRPSEEGTNANSKL